ncbi:MAG: restriction endonuclease [Betaproteobacteria bacterium]
MDLKMHDNSLFAILLRAPWWVSAALAAALVVLARLAVPEEYHLYAYFVPLPFGVIAVYALWQQLRAPSEAAVSAKLDALRGLPGPEFATVLEAAFRRDGYAVTRVARPGADLELTRAARVTLVACKRWKVARTGVEPLRELDAARESHEAHDTIYVAGGEVTQSARSFASGRRMRILEGAALAELVKRVSLSAPHQQA